jgi:hypothetical protein
MQIRDPFDPGSGIQEGKTRIWDKTAVIFYKSIEGFVQNFDLKQYQKCPGQPTAE